MAKEVVKVSPETREAYEAPKCEVMELQMEGVLCSSETGGSDWEDWGDGDQKHWPNDSTKSRNRDR